MAPAEYYVRLQRGITGGFAPPAPMAIFTMTQADGAPTLAITTSERTPGTRVLGDAVPKSVTPDTALVEELHAILKSLPTESPPGSEDIYGLNTSIVWGSEDLEWCNGGPAGCGRGTSEVQASDEDKDKFRRAVEIVEQLTEVPFAPPPLFCMYRHLQGSSPVHALPVELLSHIFLLATHHSLNTEEDDCPPFNSESVQAPLSFAAVCRHWRHVALNPALYTSLCITPELLRPATDGTQSLDLRGIAAYLKLSRNYPVDILIDGRDQEWDFDDEGLYTPWFSAQHMCNAMALILPHLHRWRSLSIFTDVCTPMHAALGAFEAQLVSGSTASRLETLRLMRCDAYAAYGEPNSAYSFLSTVPMDRMSVFPRLRRLALRGVSAAWSPLSAHLPASLRTLELAFLPASLHPSISALSAMLDATPNLEHLTLNVAGPPVSQEEIPAVPKLPNLASLSLGYTCTAAGAAVLRLVSSSASALCSISLEDASDPASLVALDAAPMLLLIFSTTPERLFPNLRRVTLRRIGSSAIHIPRDAAVLDRLELINSSEILFGLASAAREVCVRGPFVGPFNETPTRLQTRDWLEYSTVRLTETQTPRLVEVYEEVSSDPSQQSVEEWMAGETQVRVVRMASDDEFELSSEDDEAISTEGEDGMDWMPVPNSQPRCLVTMLAFPGLRGILGGNMIVRVRA
ncbi:hypothetical protein C8F01DRAFT_1259957 [Mycena amicta]|nr:hypothetical protein C8F01DRAFT_1259957 [Mycena amicta]